MVCCNSYSTVVCNQVLENTHPTAYDISAIPTVPIMTATAPFRIDVEAMISQRRWYRTVGLCFSQSGTPK